METALTSLKKALAQAQRRRHTAHRLALRYPIFPMPRVAVIGLELDGPAGTHCLKEWSNEDLRKLRPQALAGWWSDLAEVARRMLAGELDLPQLQFPILVFSRPGTAPLPARCHDLLWEWFRVPTLEQIRSEDGELLAYECLARLGFHLTPAAAGIAVPLLPEAHRCPCGDPAPLGRARSVAAAAR